MRESSAKSSESFVWLGSGSEESTLALEPMDRAGHALHDFCRNPHHLQLSSEEYYARNFPNPDTASQSAVYRSVGTPCFGRVRVHQEIPASKFYEIVVQCDKASIPWAGVESIAFAMAVVEAIVYDDTAIVRLRVLRCV